MLIWLYIFFIGFLVSSNCNEGKSQSPIDISNPAVTKDQENLLFFYQPKKVVMKNNGKFLSVEVENGNYIQSDNKTYFLKNFSIHSPSEHSIKKINYDIEFQFHHYDEKGKEIIIAILGEEGSHNLFFEKLWQNLPQKNPEESKPEIFDFKNIIPKSKTIFTYQGSLTNPPCTEGIKWIIFAEPLDFSLKQIETYHKIFKNNARPTQKLNARIPIQRDMMMQK